MADPEALTVIRQGSDAWKHWRADHPGNMWLEYDLTYLADPGYQSVSSGLARSMPQPSYVDLAGADLRDLVLPDADLEGVVFTGANLKNADLRRAKLLRADLSWANMAGANLSHAEIVDASLQFAQLSGADLSHAR